MITVRYENHEVDFYDSFHPFLASIFADYVIETKEDEWLIEIAEDLFFFTDAEEQQQIVAIAQSILEGDRKGIPSMKPHFDRRAFLYEAFAAHLDPETTFYYEPFLTFRLKEYGEVLIDCMELAIDEYLMEQDYQTMIENLRHYIRLTPAQRPMVHIIHDGMFSFYDEHFRKFTADEMEYYVKQELVFETNLDLSEMVISHSSAWRLVMYTSSQMNQTIALSYLFKRFFKNDSASFHFIKVKNNHKIDLHNKS
ncbi:putative sporulation protein YtxC [Bacillus sp. JCM 19041]|uniref:putative sporulation protein YtxC n=1 Tax=Bacillus sp. JCM 19041 TaxID=1460637 RepID=UPI000A88BC00